MLETLDGRVWKHTAYAAELLDCGDLTVPERYRVELLLYHGMEYLRLAGIPPSGVMEKLYALLPDFKSMR
jgi:hypothetical protein